MSGATDVSLKVENLNSFLDLAIAVVVRESIDSLTCRNAWFKSEKLGWVRNPTSEIQFASAISTNHELRTKDWESPFNNCDRSVIEHVVGFMDCAPAAAVRLLTLEHIVVMI